MLRISELNEKKRITREARNKRKRKNQTVTQRTRDNGRIRAKEVRRKRKIEKLKSDASLVGKITADGRRVCMWDECATVLSMYNSGECCSLHQRAWNERRGVSLHW